MLIDLYVQAGVVTGDNVRKVFDYAKEHKVSNFMRDWM